MTARLDGSADRLAALGAALCLVGLVFAARRGWMAGALSTAAGGLGLAYLLTGLAVRDCAGPACRLRRALATLPVLWVLVLVATVGMDALAYGETGLGVRTALEAAAVALLAFPTGLGYVVGSADSTTRRRTVGLAGASALVGGVLTSYSKLYVGATSFADLGVGVFVGLALPLLGAVPAYLFGRGHRN